MDEINESPRNILIAAVFCAIIGLIAYAGYLQYGWAGIAFSSDIHRAAIGGHKAPTPARPAPPDDGWSAVVTTE